MPSRFDPSRHPLPPRDSQTGFYFNLPTQSQMATIAYDFLYQSDGRLSTGDMYDQIESRISPRDRKPTNNSSYGRSRPLWRDAVQCARTALRRAGIVAHGPVGCDWALVGHGDATSFFNAVSKPDNTHDLTRSGCGPGYVYLAADTRFDPSEMKIGLAGDPAKRMSTFRTWSRTAYYVDMKYVKSMRIAESFLHEIFKSRNIDREWFSVSVEEFRWATSDIPEYMDEDSFGADV